MNGDNLSITKSNIYSAKRTASIVFECDRICMLDKGNIVESGSYDKLMTREGFFYDLVKRQDCLRIESV